MALKFTTSYLEDSLSVLRHYKKLADRAMEQVTDEQLFISIDDDNFLVPGSDFVGEHIAGLGVPAFSR